MNGNIIIKNASELITCSGFEAKKGRAMSELHIIPDGAVVVKAGLIDAVGTTKEIEALLEKSGSDLSEFDIIDAHNKAVLPRTPILFSAAIVPKNFPGACAATAIWIL